MGFSLNGEELQKYQPNRYPFLMIDRVTDVEPGQYAKGYKHLTNNEWYFPIHFPGGPNMPGALQLEAMAQMLTVAITTQDGLAGGVTHALEHTVRFKKEIIPGDTLIHRGLCRQLETWHLQRTCHWLYRWRSCLRGKDDDHHPGDSGAISSQEAVMAKRS